jgi:hypothetical protein
VIFSLFSGDWRIGPARVRPVDKVLFDTLVELSAVPLVRAVSPVRGVPPVRAMPPVRVVPPIGAVPPLGAGRRPPQDEGPQRALLRFAGLSEEIDKEFKEAGYVIWSEDGVSKL